MEHKESRKNKRQAIDAISRMLNEHLKEDVKSADAKCLYEMYQKEEKTKANT